MRALVIAPTRREARAVGHSAVVCGDADAARTIADMQRTQPIELLLIVGVCGGLDPSLAPGGVILARSAVTRASAELVPDPEVFGAVRRAMRARNTAFISSKLLTVDRPAASRAAKTMLWNTHGAAGVDMETYALAAAAVAQGIPWLAIRAVLDTSSCGLPAPLRGWRAESGERAILRAMARQPWEWPALLRLAWQMRSAFRALRVALDVVMPALESIQIDRESVAVMRKDPFVPPAVATLDVPGR